MDRTTKWAAALALDVLMGEPPAPVHPVVLTGRVIAALESRAPRAPSAALWYGTLLVVLPSVLAAAAGAGVRGLRPRLVRVAAEIWLLKSSFALRALLAASTAVERALENDRPEEGREGLSALVSRPVDALDEPHLASAAVESLAENLCDSYVAPLAAYAVGGLPAALCYRVVNTADAMVGYHGETEWLGKASARLDDVLNYIPARLSVLALVGAAPLVGLHPRRALSVGWRDHTRTESPNAGWPMATTAGALGVWLEKRGHYRLGEGADPTPADISRTRELVLSAALLVTVLAAFASHRDG